MEDLRDWRRNVPANEKNWPRFKLHFAAAHRDYIEQEMTGQGGYNTVNMVTEQKHVQDKKEEVLEQLAVATIADREAMDNLAQHISAKNSTAEALVKLQEQITVLAQQVQDMANDGKYNNNNRNNGQRSQKRGGNKSS